MDNAGLSCFLQKEREVVKTETEDGDAVVIYNLDVDALIESLAVSRQTVTVQAHVPALVKLGTRKDMGEVALEFVQGQLLRGHVTSASGTVVVQGHEAYLLVKPQGILQWTLRASSPSVERQGLPHALRSGLVPRRLQAQLDQQTWDRSHRHVFQLIDGKKDVLALAALLRKSPLELERILKDLATMHVITWE